MTNEKTYRIPVDILKSWGKHHLHPARLVKDGSLGFVEFDLQDMVFFVLFHHHIEDNNEVHVQIVRFPTDVEMLSYDEVADLREAGDPTFQSADCWLKSMPK